MGNEPSLDLDAATREAAERLRETEYPIADLCDVLIQLDDASEGESTRGDEHN